MAKKMSVDFDKFVRAFIKEYNIPTKVDIERLMTKMERVETLMKKSSAGGYKKGNGIPKSTGIKRVTASSVVLGVIKNSRNGADFTKIQGKTGFEDKKLRNIIFRLKKIGRIKPVRRGIYVIS